MLKFFLKKPQSLCADADNNRVPTRQRERHWAFSLSLNIIYKGDRRKQLASSLAVDSDIGDGIGVLLVDDEEVIRKALSRLLSRLGYVVYVAESGQEAVEIYCRRREAISLVLLDMFMPQMSGSETFSRLRDLSPELKIVLSSGYNQSDGVEDLLHEGAAGFIQKPFDINELAVKLASVAHHGSFN